MHFLIGTILVVTSVIGITMLLQERVLRRQHGVDRASFVEDFSQVGIPSSISGAVYDAYRKKAISRTFRPAPEMSLLTVFNQEREDIDDEALFILRDLNITVPPEADLKTWPNGDVNTVGDLVKWIFWVSTFPHQVDSSTK